MHCRQHRGRSILEFTHPDDLDVSRAKIDATIGGDDAPLVKRYVRADGATVEAIVTTAFVEPSGSEPYFFSQLQDVRPSSGGGAPEVGDR